MNIMYLAGEVGQPMASGWRLSEDEVLARVGSYSDDGSTDKLYEFGQMMITANRERTQQLESKAVVITGYALAILAFLVSREPSGSVFGVWPPWSVVIASVFAAGSLVGTAWTLRVHEHAWFSDGQWFENEKGVMEDADSLKRCHVLAMHRVNQELRASNDQKASGIIWAQSCLLAAGLSLAAWVIAS